MLILDGYAPSLWIYASMDRRNTVFLDSSMANGLGRRSYIGLLPYSVITEGDPREVLDSIGDDDILMGWVSYDCGRRMHGMDVHDDPESGFALADFDIIITDDPSSGTLDAVCRGRVMDAESEMALVERLIESAEEPILTAPCGFGIVSDTERDAFTDSVSAAQESMRRGDYYVINLTRRIEMESPADPFDVFLRLRRRSPSPFGMYADIGGLQIASSSMELLLDIEDGIARTRPINGTVPRTGVPEEDRKSLDLLLSSEKDRSELLMVTDMERNDMNRFCIPGTVEVESFFEPEEYSTVYHTVSDIRGRVRPDAGIGEAFGCMFPGGSVTGAPKEACMEAISELEHDRRGLYTGSAGLFSRRRTVANILIRTLVRRDGVYSLGVGGGITVESDPGSEYEETVQKGKAVLESI